MTVNLAKVNLAKSLGSIKLAVPLLVAIATILIGATFYEAEVGSAVVQQEIYKSPWFGGLMFLLAVNLGTSTLLRYPWKGARKIGFAITHWGLVVIIAGSAAVIHLSVEGMMLARTDAGPVSTLRVDGDLVEVAAPGQPSEQASLFIKADGTVVPSQVGGLSLLGYSDNAISTVRFATGGKIENPAVRLVLKSDRMGQSLERWLAAAPAAYDTIDIGPAELQLVKAQTADELVAALTPPAESPVAKQHGEVTISWLGQSRTIDIDQDLGKSLELNAQGQTLSVQTVGFWPDFRLDGNRQPVSATDSLRNPAVQLMVTNGKSSESWFVFGNPGFESIRNSTEGDPIAPLFDVDYEIITNPAPTAFFRLIVDQKGALHYAAKSSKGFKSGAIAIGDSVVPGWADFEVTLADYIPFATVEREIVPLPQRSLAGSPTAGEPALLVSVGEAGKPVWIPWGRPTAIDSEAGDWFVAFSPKLLQLPFSLKLNDFIVERNEGSESVAMWTSEVSLIGPNESDSDLDSYTVSDRSVWMNHPTWFRGWKIAQASWNPGDLSQSTLQIKREPWWVTGLTWLGSAMVTAGVATMFYGRAVAKKLTKQFKGVTDLLETPEAEDAAAASMPHSIPLFNALLGR
ncbi:cytochrome c biogenesis protein ResB [cf. Phormidesmis sp. LEGE 11477]|uniref:cytochrome c biogenesis protein ResB n=1 Tax=cf. Phormidesmis sp. LEGE 11477 TaxID=1828680 RepID=UPI00187F3661|nr:cytochrome c biogenesis protein ResB [cf. Phormidesmis sp. LEGE 11477]MBE9059919.1 cytochrome c biogenesis protein ResB [cf. Phormidesmis sp. LEGE 11477]